MQSYAFVFNFGLYISFSVRRCLNPQMTGLPAMSTFRKSGSGEVKRGYVRTATAVATKSVPPPQQQQPQSTFKAAPPMEQEHPLEAKTDFMEVDDSEPIPEVQFGSLYHQEEDDEEEEQEEDTTIPVTETSSPAKEMISPPKSSTPPPPPSPPTSQLHQQIQHPNKWGDKRPPFSYAGLLATVLDSIPERRATLSELYQHIMHMFPYYAKTTARNAWQNSIRHNLSLHKEFMRTEKAGKGGYWSMSPGYTKESFKIKGAARDELHESPRSKNIQPIILTSALPPAVTATVTSSNSRKSVHRPRPELTPPPQSQAIRRQSLEDFLELGLGRTPSKKLNVLSAIDDGSEKEANTVPIPPPRQQKSKQPSVKAEAAKPPPPTTTTTSGDSSKFSGSMDYWEQYDPEEVSQTGQGVITTESLPVDSLCFLCGSAGQEEMLYCTVCCEPYHPFCLEQEELPQSAETEKEWACKRCTTCQVCGHVEGEKLRCSECSKGSHKECLQPNQRRFIDGSAAWVSETLETVTSHCP